MPVTPDIERHPLQPFLHLHPPALTRLHVLLRWRNPLALFVAGASPHGFSVFSGAQRIVVKNLSVAIYCY